MTSVGVIGQSHLGFVTAAAIASRGFAVVGFDTDSGLIENLQHGKSQIDEPGLVDLLKQVKPNLVFSDTPSDLRKCSVIFAALDVVTDDKGQSNTESLESLIKVAMAHINDDAVLVIMSQVSPGFTRLINFDVRRLFYQVETLIFGQAVERATRPERFIVGCANPFTVLPTAYQSVLNSFGCPILPMRYESAELAKIAINVLLVASVTTANTLAEICEHIGADWMEIVPALRLDKRIGNASYIQPGLGIAGGNLERDLATVLKLSNEHSTESSVVRAFLANSLHRRDWVRSVIDAEPVLMLDEACVAVLGLAYKENTNSTKNSQAVEFLFGWSPRLARVHDPLVRFPLIPGVVQCASASEAMNGADAVVIMTPWDEYRRIEPTQIAKNLRGRIVLDPYRVLNSEQVTKAGLRYYTLGMSMRDAK
ncbi:MAG: nucleotide sugar dehydrogenase [Acidimicrobiaceae bacterium]|nr:nucleotide sugar dehydrogenase [Acidimicrobiaceae bacterium]